jgi:phage terminase large subunit-like protein
MKLLARLVMKKNDFTGKRSLLEPFIDPFEHEQALAALEMSEKMFEQFTSMLKTKPQRKKIYITTAGTYTTSPLYRQFKEMLQQVERSGKNE